MLDAAMIELWPLILAGGFVVGFLVGMTGVGAGSLMTPFLITQVGVPAPMAVGTDLLFAAITKASAAAPHNNGGNVHWPIVKWLAYGSIPGALLTLATLAYLEPDTEVLGRLIKQTLVGALLVSATAIAIYPVISIWRSKEKLSENEQVDVRPLPTLLLGLLLGTVVTMTSIGAGAIGVVILTLLYPRLIARRLIGTDIVHAVPLTLISGLAHMGMGNTNLTLLLLLLAGSLPGIAIGARLTGKLPEWLLRLILAIILVFAAYHLMQKI